MLFVVGTEIFSTIGMMPSYWGLLEGLLLIGFMSEHLKKAALEKYNIGG